MPDLNKNIVFGYNLNEDRQIDFDKSNKSIARFVRELEISLDLCISCGSCAATCSAAKFTDFSLRKINILVKRGEIDGLKEEIKKCMLCGKCFLVCPRDINTRNLILAIRKALDKYDNNVL